MKAEFLLLAILVVNTLMLVLVGLAAVYVIQSRRAIRIELQATRRAISNMDSSSLLSNMQGYASDSVRILDIIDKRLQKLEALEKIQLTQTNPNFRR